MKRTKLADRILPDYTKGEELFNFVSHVVGGVLAVAALVLGIIMATLRGNLWSIVSASIYGFTIVLLYTASSLYHGFRNPHTKKVFQIIDHCAIFILIAGTYTPLALCTFLPKYPKLAWSMFIAIWGIALLGATLNAIDLKQYAKFSMICYLGMGWCLMLAIRPLTELMPRIGIKLLIFGGIAYTIGAILYAIGKKKVRFMHGVFHIFVLLGSILHFLCILFYVLPTK